METTIKRHFETIIRSILCPEGTRAPLTQIDVVAQFRPTEETSPHAIVRNLNAAFLILLSGNTHPYYSAAKKYYQNIKKQAEWKEIATFYQGGLKLIHSEIADTCHHSKQFTEDLNSLYMWIMAPGKRSRRVETIEKVWQVFFPEGVAILEDRHRRIQGLRNKRTIRISRLNPHPITKPVREILFTSNVLLTIPSQARPLDELPVSPSLRNHIKSVIEEQQSYWYDHPIQIGVETERNEVIYGLRGLQKAVAFERQRGHVEPDETLNCILSVSVTHKGLHKIARTYLEEEFTKAFDGSDSDSPCDQRLNVYVFTEVEAAKLIDEILLPIAERYLKKSDAGLLHDIVGVDGEYGRHYSFLKAISAFWQVFIDPSFKATFKIDLDQVFPQKELVAQSGASAFEHLCTPLWGAEGLDHLNRNVELGMIAGAMVNEQDIEHSLFTPDVPFPTGEITGEQIIFFSRVPQALSTEAEMMTRYTTAPLDGIHQCVHRIHVTGGMNGILLQSLRRYRSFTPTFIGRAEDQSYLLSVLFKNTPNYLRCVHKDGLIMRHDKEAFATEAIRSARLGTIIGDYTRTLWFTYYAKALPWAFETIKDEINPFTGCFVSRIPITVVYLRLALQTATLFMADTQEKNQQGYEFVKMGARRLCEIIQKITTVPNPLIEQYQREQQGWDLYYDILDAAEQALQDGDEFALNIQQKAKRFVQDCQMYFGE